MPPSFQSENAQKTPSRRSRNEAKTPLTPSLTHALNSLSISAIPSPGRARRSKSASKSNLADITNPFIADPTRPTRPSGFSKSLSSGTGCALSKSLSGPRSRPGSPTKRTLSGNGTPVMTAEMQREASGGLIKKGKGLAGQFDVLRNDYAPPVKSEMKRSKSQPAVKRERMYPREPESIASEQSDRFITNRAEQDVAATLEMMHLNPTTTSPGHTSRLAEAANLPVNKRVLAFHEAPPASSSDPLLAKQRDIVKPLYARPASLTTSSGGTTGGKSRKIATQPERVLDAPGIVDDFYLNLIDWSVQNVVAVALDRSTYVWRADTGTVSHVGDIGEEASHVGSVAFSEDGAYLAIGTATGSIELWDVESCQRKRKMDGHQAQIASLAWNGHVLSSGCGDGSIWHHDVRIRNHKVMELLGHDGEVCGLKWRTDGEMLASGGNDNVVNVWDGRLTDSVMTGGEVESRTNAKWTKRNHTAAVKALAWCPWQPSLLASGGGTNDATIHIWNTTTGARLHSLKTPAQVTSLQFAPHKKELLSTHGYPTNALMVHAYPSLERVAEIRDAHESRVLFSCVGPAGDMVLTGAGDENLKFWRIWEVPKADKKKGSKQGSTDGGVRDGILAIR